jgi:hypothetical protein
MAEWEQALRLNPHIPTLHRNMGYTALHRGTRVDRVIELFLAGTEADSLNVDVYFGLNEALKKAGWTAGERADALLAWPSGHSMPARLVYEAARTLADAGRFDEADALFVDRFFPSEEGGTDVREVYVDVRTARAEALATGGDCPAAMEVVRGLYEVVPNLSFTRDGLDDVIGQPERESRILAVERRCGARD